MVSSITEAKQLKAPDVCMLDLSDHPRCDYGDKICCGILNLDCSSGVAVQKAVKTFGYDSLGATLRVPEEDPNLGQASCQGSLRLCLDGACPHCGLALPRAKILVRVANSTVSDLIYENRVGKPPRRELVPDEICENKTQV
uniref:Uncharacterized protein n=1 Tax=Solanum tuberosum TaxID=4113 RepID=M1AII7_SOLTU